MVTAELSLEKKEVRGDYGDEGERKRRMEEKESSEINLPRRGWMVFGGEGKKLRRIWKGRAFESESSRLALKGAGLAARARKRLQVGQ